MTNSLVAIFNRMLYFNWRFELRVESVILLSDNVPLDPTGVRFYLLSRLTVMQICRMVKTG